MIIVPFFSLFFFGAEVVKALLISVYRDIEGFSFNSFLVSLFR